MKLARDGWGGIAVFAFSAVLFGMTFSIADNPLVPLGPGFYPRIVLALSGALGLWMFVGDVLATSKAAAGAPAPAHITVAVTDVVPLASTDPRGTGLTAAMFPLVMGGMIGGIAISIAVIGALRRVLAVVVYSAVGGVLLTGILAGWFGVLQGDFWTQAAVIALALAAIAAPITGVVALIGRAGIAVGPTVMMLFANPISGAAMPREFLPGVWGQVGQWFPPGAAANLLRDVSYFPQADASFSWLVLVGWTVGGLLLSVIGHFRTAGGAEPDELAAHEDDPVSATA